MAMFSMSMWGEVYKTYAVGDLTRNGLTYEVTGLSSNDQKLNKGERKVEVPCSDAEGTLYLSGTGANADRYASIYGSHGTSYDASRKIAMTKGYSTGISFDSDDILTEGGKYYIVFGSSDDYKINAFKYTLSQACGGGDDDTAPTLSSSIPANSATNVAKSGTIILTFSEDIATVDDTKFTLTNATKGEVTIDSDPTKVKVAYSGAASGATVTLAVAAEAVADAAGNKSAALSNISFTVITSVCPAGISISGENEYTAYETISLTAALSAGNEEISYTWYKGTDLATATAAGSIGTGTSFSKVACSTEDAGNYFCVATKEGCDDNASLPYPVTVAAATACATLTPATSGDSPTNVGDEIRLQEGSTGGKIIVADYKSGKSVASSFTYTANGLSLNNGGQDSIRVELNHLMKEGTVIVAVIYNAASDDSNHGLTLQNSSKTTKATWTNSAVGSKTYSYTVVAGDGLAGKNSFILARSNTAALTSLTVSNCGDELFELSSAVSVEGKGTVTLSKSMLTEGGTATATYSGIDAAYDFDEWVISGTGATIDDASANPVTITMGAADAVITLKLKAAAGAKYTVHFDSKGGSAVADQLVEEGGHASVPTAPTKFKYTFGGWSETDGGSTPANLDEIAINDEKTFYAIWTDKVCPTSGEIFSIVYDPDKKPSSETAVPGNSRINMTTYANVTNGIAYLGNTGGSANAKITTSKFKLGGSQAYAKAELECALQEGDTIRLDNSTKIKLSLDSAKTTAITASMASGTHYWVVPKEGDDYSTIFVWQDGSNVEFSYVKVIRPNGSATAVDNTTNEIKVVKFLENGQLFIRRGEKVYTITGELVK